MRTIQYTSDADYLRIVEGARYHTPSRVALRRLLAYLAIRWGNAWLDASTEVLDGYLPMHWSMMAHHEIVADLNRNGITPEHCTLT